ncbi:APC family permease [Anaeromicrobium sediminis]|uniref:Amino acid permease n=1 Tax=Anaeromicrobium sediminis TaxID=1478221 RepID=A0A267MLH0_9FIRM|nr:APC family permease [Anaeromicrobium sediminis]PAB59620.1 hypothetical protein CCE28_08605 [Anaeromicrobium sediminis]
MQESHGISKLGVFSVSLGAIIGWGAFMQPGETYLPKAGVVNTFIGLFIGMLMLMAIEKNYAYMVDIYDDSGGEFLYAKKTLGDKIGFLTGWFLVLAYIATLSLNASAFTILVSGFLPDFLKTVYLYSINGFHIYLGEVLFTIISIGIICYINLRNIQFSSRYQIMLSGTLVSIILLLLCVFLYKYDPQKHVLNTYLGFDKINMSKILSIIALAPWAFLGFDTIVQMSEEYECENSTASKLAVLSIISGFIIYNILNVMTASVYTKEAIVNGNIQWATGDAVSHYLGDIGLVLLFIALGASVLAGMNGFILASSRLILSMSREKVLPESFGNISENNIPHNAVKFVALVSCLTAFLGRNIIVLIVNMASLGGVLAFFFTSMCVYKLNKKFNIHKFFAGLGMIFSTIFMIILLIPSSPAFMGIQGYILLILWGITGFFFYKYKSNYKLKNKEAITDKQSSLSY